MLQWREEAKAQEEVARREQEENRWYRRISRQVDGETQEFLAGSIKFLAWFEQFIGNLPLTIGAVALAIANLGVDWFKFAEENLESCEPVHFHSAQCTFPEFPGCFYCDTDSKLYKVALRFHWTCSAISGILCFAFLSKLLFAWNLVLDELSSPTTATPAGLVCQALDVVFAGRGMIGMLVVSSSSFVHFLIAVWFIYLVLAYRIMPDPSWFPNTVSIGLSAVKTWLYFPMAGHFLMAVSDVQNEHVLASVCFLLTQPLLLSRPDVIDFEFLLLSDKVSLVCLRQKRTAVPTHFDRSLTCNFASV